MSAQLSAAVTAATFARFYPGCLFFQQKPNKKSVT